MKRKIIVMLMLAVFTVTLFGTGSPAMASDDIKAVPPVQSPQVVTVTGDPYLYYLTPLVYEQMGLPSNKSYHLCRIGKDGTNQQQLSPGMVLKYQIVGDWIYYFSVTYINRDESDHQSGEIYRMKKDGTGVERINIGQTSGYPNMAVDFAVADDWIYYIDDTYKSHRIWRTKADGTQNTQISPTSAAAFSILNNRLYYQRWYEGDGLYSVNMDGSDLKVECPNDMIVSGYRDTFDITSRDGWVAYEAFVFQNKSFDSVYFLYKPSTGAKISVSDNTMNAIPPNSLPYQMPVESQLLGEYNNGVYVLNNQNVVVYQSGSSEARTIIAEKCMMAQLDGSTLYYITAGDNQLHSLSLAQ